jgi:glucose-fructose oxidoreductase
MAPYQQYAGVRGTSPLGEISFPYDVPWQQAKQMDDDCQSIINSQPMQVPGEEGQRDIRIVEAVYAAAKTGQRVKV